MEYSNTTQFTLPYVLTPHRLCCVFHIQHTRGNNTRYIQERANQDRCPNMNYLPKPEMKYVQKHGNKSAVYLATFLSTNIGLWASLVTRDWTLSGRGDSYKPSICMSSSDLTRRLASCSESDPRRAHIESISSTKIVLGA